MLDSVDVLNTLKLAYGTYMLVVVSLFGWFGYRLTRGKTKQLIRPLYFYIYIGVLVFVGVAIHILTYNKIPWVASELKKDSIQAERTIKLSIGWTDESKTEQAFVLPEKPITIDCGQVVRFDIESKDLTYGFGLFRKNQSLVLQTQVTPGSRNELLWEFHKNGIYDLRSTEYSGPIGAGIFVEDAVQVTGCDVDDTYSMKGDK